MVVVVVMGMMVVGGGCYGGGCDGGGDSNQLNAEFWSSKTISIFHSELKWTNLIQSHLNEVDGVTAASGNNISD